ncbi:MAG TPA: hypothetical protein VMW10_04395 [Alphaproteobacteria bacterium]|nr:hypothetical protein [Alphaproteobacteria bacterium]
MVKNVVTSIAVVALGLSFSSVAEAGKTRRTEVERLEDWGVKVQPKARVGDPKNREFRLDGRIMRKRRVLTKARNGNVRRMLTY